MKKNILLVFVLAGFAPSARAQYYGYGVAGQAAQRAIENAALAAHAAANTGYVGGYYGGYPSVGGDRIARDIGVGLFGAGVGGAFGGRRGALIGAAAGVGAAELGGYLMARRGGSAAAGPSAGSGQGDFELSNSMQHPVDVYLRDQKRKEKRDQKRKEKFLGRLTPGDSWAVNAPKPSEAYYGFALIPNYSGGLSSDRLVPTPMPNGWVFTEPPEAVAQGGRR